MTASNVAMIDDFNPRSHEGSDVSGTGVEAGSDGISIHAPTRGATSSDKPTNISSYISIHAPTRGATGNVPSLALSPVFQSTLPRGERPVENGSYILPKIFQSTLPRGERRFSEYLFRLSPNYFNPRSHEGSDIKVR